MGKDLKGKELGVGFTQRKDGRYCARYINKNGERKYLYDTSISKLRMKFKKEIFNDIKEDTLDDITMNSWFDQYMSIYKTHLKRNTAIRYISCYEKMIKPYIGDKRITDIKNIDIMLVVNECKTLYSYRTINKAISIMKEALAKAVNNELIRSNPASDIKRISNYEDKKIKAMTREQQIEFENIVSGTFYDSLFILALNTGMRFGEISGLTIDDIDFDNMMINVNKTMVRYPDEWAVQTPKTHSSYRKIPINKRCYEALQKQLVRRKNVLDKTTSKLTKYEKSLFITLTGRPIEDNFINYKMSKFIEELNRSKPPKEYMPRFTFHSLRHTFATRCFELGVDVKTVSSYLGHASIKQTLDTYTHLFDNKAIEKMTLLDNFNAVRNTEFTSMEKANYEAYNISEMSNTQNKNEDTNLYN